MSGVVCGPVNVAEQLQRTGLSSQLTAVVLVVVVL